MTQKDPHVDFEHIIARLTYPASKEEIIDAVRTHGSTNSTVAIAEKLPNEIFTSSGSVLESMKN